MTRRIPRRIAPRLASGDRRDPLAHGIPPHVKAALKMIAASHNESLSWMLERAMLEYFSEYTKTPEYVERKTPEIPTARPGRAPRRRVKTA